MPLRPGPGDQDSMGESLGLGAVLACLRPEPTSVSSGRQGGGILASAGWCLLGHSGHFQAPRISSTGCLGLAQPEGLGTGESHGVGPGPG